MRIKMMDIDGIRTRYLYAGKGSPLILLHGVGLSGDTFVRNIGPLAKNFSVYAPDMLGHGFTDAVDLKDEPPQPHMVAHLGQLADRLGLERYSILGSSYGALVAALMYFDRPHRVDKLILVGTGSTFNPAQEQEKTLRGVFDNASTAMEDPTLDSCRQRLKNICYNPASAPEEILLTQLTSYALPDRFDAYKQCPSSKQMGLLSLFHKGGSGSSLFDPAFPKYRRYSVRREGDSAIRIMKL